MYTVYYIRSTIIMIIVTTSTRRVLVYCVELRTRPSGNRYYCTENHLAKKATEKHIYTL